MYNAKFRAISLLLALMLAFVSIPQASAGFSSIYVFGDGVCTTTGNGIPPTPVSGYYGNRFCNGKVWVEVLSDWQGVTYSSSKNVSDFGHDSVALKASVDAFVAPEDVATSLFVVWCNDADFVDFAGIYDSSDNWTGIMNQSIDNHTEAITTLYNKGVRLILAPNVVDIMETPFYVNYTEEVYERNFFRDRVIEYNGMFEAAMVTLMGNNPGLKVLYADTFTFFDQVISNPADYGLINPPAAEGNAGGLDSGDSALDGAGAVYVFWDDYHPTAKFQMHLADFFQQIVSPAKVNSIACAGGNVLMQVANIPLGRDGSIQGSSNLLPPWSSELSISEPFVSGGSTTKSYSFPASGAKRFYRVGFPVVWTWP